MGLHTTIYGYGIKSLTRPINIVRYALWTALHLRLLCVASPILHKIHNHKSAVVGGVACSAE